MHGGPYLTPRGLIRGARAADLVAAKQAWTLCGTSGAFTAIDVTTVDGATPTTALLTRAGYDNMLVCAAPLTASAIERVLAAMSAPRAPFAALDLSRPRIMGIVNATPDSFSDGGRHASPEAAIAHGIALAEAGADIIDVGGESTRPGAAPVDPAAEQARVVPVVQALAARGCLVSIDTRHPATMQAACAAGARIINDVTALATDGAPAAAASSGAAVILMHMQGEPRTMQNAPTYRWAPGDVFDALAGRVAAVRAAGIPPERIAIDPGLGFGKTEQHSAAILDHLALFHGLGLPLAIGGSRKRMIAAFSRGEPVDERLAGSIAIAAHAVGQGAHIIRVHDVAETRQALGVLQRLGAA